MNFNDLVPPALPIESELASMAAGGGGVPPPHVLGSLFAPRTVALVVRDATPLSLGSLLPIERGDGNGKSGRVKLYNNGRLPDLSAV